MSARLVRTRHPGIYKRGSRYVVSYRVDGQQKRETLRTLKDAVRLKRARETDRDRGEYQEQSKVQFREYAEEWVGRHLGIRESTRDDYRRDLQRYAFPFLSERLGRTVSGVTRHDLARWVAWLCDEREQGRRLADATVRRIASPVRAALSAAADEGLIRANPAHGLRLPTRAAIEEDEDARVRVLDREQLAAFLQIVHPRHRTMFRLLAGTGLRWGELAALRRRDLALDGSRPAVRVRRALTRGGKGFGPPKSRHGRRDVDLSPALVAELRSHLAALESGSPDDLAFPSRRGTPLGYPNLLRRVLKPVAQEVGAPWAGFHTFRHTFASLHLARGTTLVQLSRLLGHHSPEFTLRRYAHLIPGDEAEALDLTSELADVPTTVNAEACSGSKTSSSSASASTSSVAT